MDDDTVIGRAVLPEYARPGMRMNIELSDLDDEWQKKLKCIHNDDNNGTVWPFEYRERIEELEAEVERYREAALDQSRRGNELEAELEAVAEERDEARFQCKVLGERGDALEAKVAAKEKALKAADDADCTHCGWELGRDPEKLGGKYCNDVDHRVYYQARSEVPE